MDDCVKRYKQRRDERLKARTECFHSDYGVKGMKWGEHKAEEEKNGSSPKATPMSDADMQKEIGKTRGKVHTTIDVKNFAKKIDEGASDGDSISAKESNRWHNITDTYTKGKDGWRYVRKNDDTGEVYEDRNVDAYTVAREVLSTSDVGEESQSWRFKSNSSRN